MDLAKTYTLQATVKYVDYLTVQDTTNFSVTVIDPCPNDSLTIDNSLTSHSYTVGGDPHPISWDESIVTSDNSYSVCGDITWTIIDKDTGVVPITDILTVTVTGGTVDILVDSDDKTLVKTYNL